jgi:hypothetical protein
LQRGEAKVTALYREAAETGDTATTSAIERLPVVHEGQLPNDELATLKRERFAIEAPELHHAFEVAEDAHATVETALHAAESIVADHGQGLPDPDDSDEASTGDDGLRRISISQFEEVRAYRSKRRPAALSK